MPRRAIPFLCAISNSFCTLWLPPPPRPLPALACGANWRTHRGYATAASSALRPHSGHLLHLLRCPSHACSCVWCKSQYAPGLCYDEASAKYLPQRESQGLLHKSVGCAPHRFAVVNMTTFLLMFVAAHDKKESDDDLKLMPAVMRLLLCWLPPPCITVVPCLARCCPPPG